MEDSLEGVKLKTDTPWKMTVIFRGRLLSFKARQSGRHENREGMIKNN